MVRSMNASLAIGGADVALLGRAGTAVGWRAEKSCLSPVVLIVVSLLLPARLFAATAAVTIDFNSVEHTLSALTFGMNASGYGANKTQLPRQPAQQRALATLGVAVMRINLGYLTPGDPGSPIVCLAAGADRSLSGDEWVAAIRASGALPAIRVQMNAAIAPEIWAADAANLVRHFNQPAGGGATTPVTRWIIGNEPDANKLTAETYTAGFAAMFRAMKAIDPAIQIGGPAVSHYKPSYLVEFFARIAREGVVPDFVIWHSYGTGTSTHLTDAPLLAITKQKYFDEPATIRAMLVKQWGAEIGSQIPIELGEWNSSGRADPRQLQHYDCVWTALALSHMVKAGITERFYTDKNSLMGVVCDLANPTKDGVTYAAQPNDPMPKYHGIGMFTGEKLFRGFGREVVTVTATSSTGLIDVAVSRSPMNIVAINSSPTEAARTTFTLGGVANASVEVWQKNAANLAPEIRAPIVVTAGSFAYDLEPYSVTTFLVTAR